MKLRERKKSETNSEVPKAPKTKTNPLLPQTKTKTIKQTKTQHKLLTTKTATDRVTRSRSLKPTSMETDSKRKLIEDKRNANEKIKKSKKIESNSNQITNYFKVDTTPKEQRLEQNFLNTTGTGKKACWAKASLILSKSQSKPSADPYEFVDDLPKPKRKTKRRATLRSTPYTKMRKERVQVDEKLNQSKQLKEAVLNSTLTDTEITDEGNSKTKTTIAFHHLDLSSITGTNKSEIHNLEKSSNIGMDTNKNENKEITPVKNDKQVDNATSFKTPAMPVKPKYKNSDFFAKATAVSTPKVATTTTKVQAVVASGGKEKTLSADYCADRIEEDIENLPLPHTDVSPISSNLPINSDGELRHREIQDVIDDEMNFCSDNEENSRILSGSFVETGNGVYENEYLKRASTPDNEEIDHSVLRSNSIHVITEKDLVLKNSNTSSLGDAFSLYGSPIKMSPVKTSNEAIRPKKSPKQMNTLSKENTKNSKPLSIQSDNQVVKPVRKTYGKKEVKPKKEDPSEAAFEKWLRDMTNEFEEVQNFPLLIE